MTYRKICKLHSSLSVYLSFKSLKLPLPAFHFVCVLSFRSLKLPLPAFVALM